MKERVRFLVIGCVNKTGLLLEMENMDARKLAVVATKKNAHATTGMNIIVKAMCFIMVKLFVDLNGLFRILENMAVNSLVISANMYIPI